VIVQFVGWQDWCRAEHYVSQKAMRLFLSGSLAFGAR
jgi:hypothetical protein